LGKNIRVYLYTRLRNVWFLLVRFHFKEILRKIQFRIYSDTHSIGLLRDLTQALPPPDAQILLTVRPIQQSDIPIIFDFKRSGLSNKDKLDMVNRFEHIHANIPTCYVAVTRDNTPVFMEWLMGHTENETIQAYFNGVFPWLSPDEMLLENALTAKEFRGKGIMAAAVARICDQAKLLGARRVITFIEQNNIASLKASRRAGFIPYSMRHEKWFLFRRSLTITELPSGVPYISEVFPMEIVAIYG
jgi:hypothetical protein